MARVQACISSWSPFSNENIYLIVCIQFLPFYLIKLEDDDILEATIFCNTNPVIIPYEWTKGRCIRGWRQTMTAWSLNISRREPSTVFLCADML